MSQIPEYQRGHRDAMRKAITWLHIRARSMNDPHAQRVLDSAASDLGVDQIRIAHDAGLSSLSDTKE